jgi:NADH-quinone oxidoreductase B subunit
MGLVTDRLPRIVENIPGGGILITSLDAFINWSRRNSLWPLAFGTKCCAIEMLMATGAPHQDLSRFGAEVARQSPRQADFMVIAGAVVKKMAPRVRMLYEQMAEPRYVMATGSCAISGGPFMYNSYTIVRGVDEAFFYGLMALQRMIREGESIARVGMRRKPVMAALPQGIKPEDFRDEVRRLLESENDINVDEAAASKIWLEKVDQWMAKHLLKP